ncbi:MarR family winged helix-turn-helix transcriptional regulator [Gordonia oryzae]|uniref:MarR family winged helix-turn-helix transcriptional regulator n=1 Tax=Gordonia oryzae TaxID=2487349 RepID=UPI001FE80A8B|nr:MarR family winged helix-turn-helix transcriptional regulator [Gordonia oryzae]
MTQAIETSVMTEIARTTPRIPRHPIGSTRNPPSSGASTGATPPTIIIGENAARPVARSSPADHTGPSGVVPLNRSEAAVMRWVHRHLGGTPAQDATATRLQRSNFSVVMRSLEVKAMIVREPDPGDVRSVRLYPADLAPDSIARLHEFWAHMISGALETQTSAVRSRSSSTSLRTALEVLCALDKGLLRAR